MSRSVSERPLLKGTYIGPIAHLRGEQAIILTEDPYGRRHRRRLPKGVIFAQFDNLLATKRSYRPGQPRPRAMRRYLAHGWTPFRPDHWQVRVLEGSDRPKHYKAFNRNGGKTS